jgi:hypothetical protein
MPDKKLRNRAAAITGAAVLFAGVAFVGAAATQGPAPDREVMIREALSAAPPTLRDSARIVDGAGTLLREGASGFTCMPAPQGIAGPVCLDAQWMEWLDAYANKRAPNITGIGLAYMLAGDTPDGGASNTNPYDTAPTADNHWVVEGPHVMVLLPDTAALESMTAAHDTGGPYVMWKGTPYAHIMMPVGPRPQQRQAAGR